MEPWRSGTIWLKLGMGALMENCVGGCKLEELGRLVSESEDFERFLNWNVDFERWKSEGFFCACKRMALFGASCEDDPNFLLLRVDTELPMARWVKGKRESG